MNLAILSFLSYTWFFTATVVVRTLKWQISFVPRQSERAQNVRMNPKHIPIGGKRWKSLFKSPSRGTTTAITVVVPGLYQQMIWRSLIPQDTVQDCSHNFFPNITYDAHFSDFMYPTMYAHKVLKIITKSIFVFS